MGITRLKRKARRNKQRSADRVNKIKQLTSTPVIANVDKEELKASFEKTPKAEAKKEKAVAEEAPKAEKAIKAEKSAVEEAPKAKKPAAKKAKAEKKTEE